MDDTRNHKNMKLVTSREEYVHVIKLNFKDG